MERTPHEKFEQEQIVHKEISIDEHCKNLEDSYGIICVRCNACGRLYKNKEIKKTGG